MVLGHILGEGATDELVASAIVLVGLVFLLRRSERKARERHRSKQEGISEQQE